MSNSGEYVQNVAIITIFIGVSSTILSKFLQVVLNSRGLMNRWDIFTLAVISWLVFFLAYQGAIIILKPIESKRPLWLLYLRYVGGIVNIVIGVFLSIYLSGLLDTVNFQSFGFEEVIMVLIAGILFLAMAQLVFIRYAVLRDPRRDFTQPETSKD